jgi:ABC-type multidrug transport system fused ATPase/permease subunit
MVSQSTPTALSVDPPQMLLRRLSRRIRRLLAATRDIYEMVPDARFVLWLALVGSLLLALADGLVAVAVIPIVGEVVGGKSQGFAIVAWLKEVIRSMSGTDPVARMMWGASILIAGMVIRQVVNGIVQTIGFIASLKVVMRLRESLVDALLHTDFSYLDTIESGRLRQVIMAEMPQVGTFVRGVVGVVSSLLTVIVLVAIMVGVNANLVLLALALSPLALAWKYFHSRLLYRKATYRTQLGHALAQTLNEAIMGLRQLKLTNRQAEFGRQMTVQSRETESARNDQFLLVTWEPLAIQVVALIIILALLWLAPATGISSFDEVVVFAFLLYRLMPSLMNLNTNFNVMLVNEPSVDNALTAYGECRAARENPSSPDAEPVGEIDRIEFLNTGLDLGRRRGILADVNIKARRGEIIAVVGASGAGKTSLVHLLLGMYRPSSGRIEIDGRDIGGLQLEGLRRNIGIVSQDVHLFDTTVANIIKGGSPTLAQDDVEHAARGAGIHDFVQTLPKKYETRVGERGVTLSGGQRQRLLLAQVLARQPSVIIFDEATSALDSLNEKHIFETIQSWKDDHISIVITHRLENLGFATRIYVLDEGRVVQTGSWSELSSIDGTFRQMLQRTDRTTKAEA